MKFSKLDLLTLLISLFLFASCNKSSSLGLELDPEEAIEGALIDTLTILSTTTTDDPVPTYLSTNEANPARLPFGYLTDAEFGTTEASLALTVGIPSAKYNFGNNPVVDSAVLVLPYTAGFYGDTTSSVYSIDVQQLSSNLATETSFLSNREWAANADIIGTYEGKVKPTTPVRYTTIVSGGPDTVRSAPASIRIKLKADFVQNNIVDLGAVQLNNNATFAAAIKGLKVSINKANSTGQGGIMFFDLSAANSNIEVYYKKDNATNTAVRDTLAVNLPVRQSVGPIAATVKHDYTGTPVEAQLADATKQFDVTYLQGLGGLRNKISIPYLQDFVKNTGGKIVINKAELVVDLSSGTDVAPFTPAPRLALYQYDLAGQRALIQDQSTSDFRYTGNFGTLYNTTTKKYTFIMTAYVQDLIDGKTKDLGTYLAPAPGTEYSVLPSVTSAARSVIGSFNNPNNKVKLNIFYTKY